MELKLNIYDGNDIIKTYTAQGYRLKMGTIEEVIKLVDVEKFANVDLTNAAALANDNVILLEIVKLVIKAFDKFRPLMMDIFKDLTVEDYNKTDFVEIGLIVWNVIQYTFGQLGAVVSGKN